MSIGDTLLSAIRAEFEPPGYLSDFSLRRLEIEGTRALIEFSGGTPFPGIYRITLPIPGKVGDEVWRRYDDATEEPKEWVRWGIAVPVQESYEMNAAATIPDEHGVKDLPPPA